MDRLAFVADHERECFCVKTSIKKAFWESGW